MAETVQPWPSQLPNSGYNIGPVIHGNASQSFFFFHLIPSLGMHCGDFQINFSAVWLSGVTEVCRHLLFSFHSLVIKWTVRLMNGVMVTLDHMSVVVENKSLSCSSAMMVCLVSLNNCGMTVSDKYFLLGSSYCLSNECSISLNAGFSTARSGAFSTTKYVAMFLVSVFHLSLSRLYLASLEKASPILT